jgi:hypothetical protein
MPVIFSILITLRRGWYGALQMEASLVISCKASANPVSKRPAFIPETGRHCPKPEAGKPFLR